MKGCVFCELPQWELHGGLTLTLEPLNPVVPGHRIFICRYHIESVREEPDITGTVFAEAARYASFRDPDFNLIVNNGPAATQTVKHLHVHYVPRRPDDGLHLPWTGQKT